MHVQKYAFAIFQCFKKISIKCVNSTYSIHSSLTFLLQHFLFFFMSLDQLVETAAHKHGNILVPCREAENMLVEDPSHTTTSHIFLLCVVMCVRLDLYSICLHNSLPGWCLRWCVGTLAPPQTRAFVARSTLVTKKEKKWPNCIEAFVFQCSAQLYLSICTRASLLLSCKSHFLNG